MAKLFIRAKKGITFWKKVKKMLKEEFNHKKNSAEFCKLLNKRRIK